MNVVSIAPELKTAARKKIIVEIIKHFAVLLSVIFIFLPLTNPALISLKIDQNISLYETVASKNAAVDSFFRNINIDFFDDASNIKDKNIIKDINDIKTSYNSTFKFVRFASTMLIVGIGVCVVASVFSLLQINVKKYVKKLYFFGAVILFFGVIWLYQCYQCFCDLEMTANQFLTNTDEAVNAIHQLQNIDPVLPVGIFLYLGIAVLLILFTLKNLEMNRFLIFVAFAMVFFPEVNPGKETLEINPGISLFTAATSINSINGANIILVGVIINVIGACMSMGNNKMKKYASFLPIIGSVLMFVGLFIIDQCNFANAENATAQNKLEETQSRLTNGFFVFAGLAATILISSIIQCCQWMNRPSEGKLAMDEKYRLFLMLLPVLVLTFLFCYLPLYSWRYAFYNYEVGDQLSANKFAGLQWFSYLFENSATRDNLLRVLKNTLIISSFGIITSWLPMAFAILLAEVRTSKFRCFVQTFTTIPHFISWVLVYSIAISIFSTDGFINSFLTDICGIPSYENYLLQPEGTWLKMLLWSTWKGIGWSAIIYIAGIARIDQQLYEAARVEGANRWQCICHITLPGLTPTYYVMLLMNFAGIMSNGMEQYLVFSNDNNAEMIEVLDLYVYNIGITNSMIPMSTVIGISKFLIAVILLFIVNRISKSIRGESFI